MFGIRALPSRKKEEGENPFWISYADLMTALMILFLVLMVASLLSVTKKINSENQEEKIRTGEIKVMCENLKSEALKVNRNIEVDCKDNRVNFGAHGQFEQNQYRLGPEGTQSLQELVPLILKVASGEEGKKWFKQIIIEGFTDTDGSYLYNLHLSLQRSEWIMCSLLASNAVIPNRLTPDQLNQVRQLFLVGGVASNQAKTSKEASRRVELRLQFYGLKENGLKVPPVVFHMTQAETCQLN